MSPLALRKRFLPRAGGQPQAAHLQPVSAAAETQAQHHQVPNAPQKETKKSSTSHRITLERFKPGFEEETEKQLAAAFCRPPRTYKQDPPFYPWLPPAPKIPNF